MNQELLSNMWKYAISDPKHATEIQKTLLRYAESRIDVDEYLKKPSHQQLIRRVGLLEDREMQRRFDFYETAIGLQHRTIMRKVLDFARQSGHAPRQAMWVVYTVFNVHYLGRRNHIPEQQIIDWMAQYEAIPESAVHAILTNIAAIKANTQIRRHMKGIECIDEVLDFMQTALTDTELFSIESGNLDEELVELIEQRDDFEQACGNDVLDEFSEASASAKALFEQDHDELEEYRLRLARTCERLTAPVTGILQEDSTPPTMFIRILIASWEHQILENMHWYMRGLKTTCPTHERCTILACDPMFWMTAIQVIMAKAGMIDGDTMDEEAFQMVVDAVQRPKKFHKDNCSKRLVGLQKKLRSTLAAWVMTPVKSERTKAAFSSKTEAPSSMRLSILATELALLQQDRVVSGYKSTGVQMAALEDLFHLVHSWSYEELLDGLCITYLRGLAKALENVADKLKNEIEQTESVEEEEDDSGLPMEALPVGFDEKPIKCRYVSNPDSGITKYEDVEFRNETDMQDFLHRKKIGITIKPSSALNAIRYYGSIPDDIKHTAIKEDVHGQRWHKLKRDTARILLHEEDGHTYVHIYQRKDWKHKAY